MDGMEPSAYPQETQQVLNSFSAQQMQLQNFHWRNNSLAFTLTELTEAVQSAVRESVANADESVRRLRHFRTQQARTHAHFAEQVTKRFGALPEHEQDR